ncbi:Stk1 family PASTA domain-containing Ser/Thr kinase [Selenomonas ruminantium]|uniref:non-specific serine/threonine protein kinase n=1 Tax=Selenomonas ruminantium TaxID=971 RepID=A0A1K1LSP4_SELRU|nr:Stk1 family PASTA domain-containing Ser/Thr kinase [Selenomonas ruminantium]SFW13945.1 serine/threonine protein kinase [Selenomonas ruminantium]
MNQRVLDNRYELQELIGGGGMADVYKARDILLDRTVAVKILHEQFKRDTEFIQKFHREAQAAAKLSHPNIVNIYDVGVMGDDHYIVMEYVPGSTLKDRIKQEGHLSVADALHVARDIASALAHAHANNLVHCDIKPHNILMMADGSAKVADFGIARAVTESTMTYTGNVVGSVHYFSPEQAKGTMITPRSDVYALGVVLYEMLTGQLPFTGETPVSIAMKHLQEQPRSVRQLDESIPPVVEAIVARAMQKDANMRPSSSELVQDITQAQQMLGGYSAGVTDPYATQVLPRVQESPLAVRSERYAQPAYDEDEEEDKSIFKSKKFVAGLVMVLMMGFFVGAFLSFGKFWSTAEVEVPDVTGKQMTLAKQILEDKRLRVKVDEEFSAEVPAGMVISQNPEGGAKVKEERLITIKVSKGGENIEMPDIRGLKKADAIAKLEKMGLKIGLITEKASDTEEAGVVISTDPRVGTRVTRGETIDLVISKGKKEQKSSVPDVTGLPLESARKALTSAGFKVGSVERKASKQAEGTVISQSPGGGAEALTGESIHLVVAEAGKTTEEKTDKSTKKDSGKQEAVAPKPNESSKSR